MVQQNLRIKALFCTSENAVKSRIRITVSVGVLVAITCNRRRLDMRLHTVLQTISIMSKNDNKSTCLSINL